ncbi:4-hydroxy-3-methylbut-2-enyl diphosphate reductase [Petropleomorpha daqingensis]|uniref:4-hydroxy-3-methylbut-2-enyl diphosphate reductase n=1 Tax=Petropleomorpha daqingensis TaxID=2026353 RepID=A0A853CLK2_9ACTN|nr:4-hydroxy-3-methylbut-2-enyl diphosphate reductase [Petropleomorpha daqingensis]NYJ07138.1 4-hydroxy-3-methylbut-2-enyl diphosphate reductase [Petropleomorpha daqingensis]
MSAVVAVPLRAERAALAGRLPGTRVVRTGMGPDRSAARTRALGADAVLVAGVAGALDERLRPGDVVVASELRGGGASIPSPSAPLLAAALRRGGLTVHVGPLLTRSSVRGPGGNALAVDMESAAVAAAAGAPTAAVRAIVDTPSQPLLRPGTAVRGVRALAALRRAAPALQEWVAAAGPREVLLASPRSFCAGVERAIGVVERALETGPVYVRRQIVHNAHVVADLEARGAVFVEEVDEVPERATVVLAAHGVAPSLRADAARRGLAVVDATCPLVAKVHSEVRRYAGRGDTVFLIGHADHEEVVGTRGEAPGRVVVVEDAEQAERVQPADPDHVAYVMQTTLAVDEAEQVAAVLRRRFPALTAPRSDDICYATTNRQRAVRELADATDLVLVVGSANSSNSVRLVEVAEREGTPAHLVEDAAAVDLRWLAGAARIGITAGASAPPSLVDDLVAALGGLGPLTVRSTAGAAEYVRFALPKESI